MSLYHLYCTAPLSTKNMLLADSELLHSLVTSFQSLQALATPQKTNFDLERDRFRDRLTAYKPDDFPRWGSVMIDVSDIFSVLRNLSSCRYSIECELTCQSPTCSQSRSHNFLLSSVCHPSLSANHGEAELALPFCFSLQDWITQLIQIRSERHSASIMGTGTVCILCGSSVNKMIQCHEPPPFWTLEVAPDVSARVVSCKELMIPNEGGNIVYALAAVIYVGDAHFNARLVDNTNRTYVYDGQLNTGCPTLDQTCTSDMPHLLQTLSTKKAYNYIYVLQTNMETFL